MKSVAVGHVAMNLNIGVWVVVLRNEPLRLTRHHLQTMVATQERDLVQMMNVLLAQTSYVAGSCCPRRQHLTPPVRNLRCQGGVQIACLSRKWLQRQANAQCYGNLCIYELDSTLA